MSALRRFHLDLRPVTVHEAGRRITFVGVTFHARTFMLEYDVVPPLRRDESPFGPALIGFVVTDDVRDSPYETQWEDFVWELSRPGRVTTRFQGRPPPQASEIRVSVRRLLDTSRDGHRVVEVSDEELIAFEVVLPADHANPLRP